MKIRIGFKVNKITKKVKNEKLGLFIATDWKRFMNPYVQRNTGNLMNNVEYHPFAIHYKAPYASLCYFNPRGVRFVQNGTGRNPFATDHWDRAAEKAGQKDKLYRDINAFLNRQQTT